MFRSGDFVYISVICIHNLPIPYHRDKFQLLLKIDHVIKQQIDSYRITRVS